MSIKFPTELDVIFYKSMVDGLLENVVRLNRDFYYTESQHCDNVRVIAGFVSDGASVPKILWRWYPPFGRYLRAAIVHDWFCVLGRKGESPIDSVDAAKVFREAMKACGVSKWRRNKMYWAVRIGGPRFKAKKT